MCIIVDDFIGEFIDIVCVYIFDPPIEFYEPPFISISIVNNENISLP